MFLLCNNTQQVLTALWYIQGSHVKTVNHKQKSTVTFSSKTPSLQISRHSCTIKVASQYSKLKTNSQHLICRRWFSPVLSTRWYSRGAGWQEFSVLQQVKAMKSQVGGHALTHRLNRNLNLFLLFCKEWEIQCECVGKLVNHCCVAKKTDTEKKQRDNHSLWRAKQGPLSPRQNIIPNWKTFYGLTSTITLFGGLTLLCILPVRLNFLWLAPAGSLLTFFKDLGVAKKGEGE